MKLSVSGCFLAACLALPLTAEWKPLPDVRERENFPHRIRLDGHAALPENSTAAPAVADFIAAGLSAAAGRPVENPLELSLDNTLAPEAYELDLRQAPGKLRAGGVGGWWNGAALFLDYARSGDAVRNEASLTLPAVRISDAPDLPLRAIDFQWCYRPVPPDVMSRCVRTLRALRMNTIVPEFGPMVRWTAAKSPVPLEDARAFLAECARNGVAVIPKLNSFGHSDRGFPWPEMLGEGLDMRSEANYTALEAEVLAWKRELAAVGLPMKYFHFGMDEASDCLKHNIKRYNSTAPDLVAGHMNRIAELCRKIGTIGIIYHDMLIGSREPIYWRDMGTPHADANGSYLARPRIDRRLAVNYWNYEGFDRYRTIEALKREGFAIFFTPWGGSSVRKMAKNARLYGEGLIGSTWCDFPELTGNSIYNQAWVRDGLVDVAVYGWDTARADTPRLPDGGRRWTDHFRDRPTRRSGAIPVFSGVRPIGRKGVVFSVGNPVRLGKAPATDYDTRFAAMLEKAEWPLSLFIDGKPRARIDHLNQPTAFNGLTLYTARYGRETGTDIYSTEARIQNGTVFSKNDWGVGHTLIPRSGAVISGWGEDHYGLPSLPVGAKAELRDASGRPVPWRPSDGVEHFPESAAIALPKGVTTLHFLHRTAFEGDLSAAPVVTAVLELSDGTEEKRMFHYGRHLAADGEELLTATDDPGVWLAEDGVYAYSWECRPGSEPLRLRLELTPEGVESGYRLEALSAESRFGLIPE